MRRAGDIPPEYRGRQHRAGGPRPASEHSEAPARRGEAGQLRPARRTQPRAPPRPSGLGRRRRWQGVAHRGAPGVAGHDGAGVRPVAVGGRLGHPDGRRPLGPAHLQPGDGVLGPDPLVLPGTPHRQPLRARARQTRARQIDAGVPDVPGAGGLRVLDRGARRLETGLRRAGGGDGRPRRELGPRPGHAQPARPRCRRGRRRAPYRHRPARAAGRRPRPASQPAGRPDRPEPGGTALRHRDGRAVRRPFRDPRRAPRPGRRRALRPGGRARGRP